MAIKCLEPCHNAAKSKKESICTLTNSVINLHRAEMYPRVLQSSYKYVCVHTAESKGLTSLYQRPIHRGGIKVKSIIW